MLVLDMVLLLRMRITYHYSDTKDRCAYSRSVTELKEENWEDRKAVPKCKGKHICKCEQTQEYLQACDQGLLEKTCSVWGKDTRYKLKNRIPLSLVDLQSWFQNIQTCKHSSFLCLTAQYLHMSCTNPPRCFKCSLEMPCERLYHWGAQARVKVSAWSAQRTSFIFTFSWWCYVCFEHF